MSARPTAADRLTNPDAVLTRSDLRKLGLERRGRRRRVSAAPSAGSEVENLVSALQRCLLVQDELPVPVVSAVDSCDRGDVRRLTRTIGVRRVNECSRVRPETNDLRVVNREVLPRLGVLDSANDSLSIGHSPAGEHVYRVRRKVRGIALLFAGRPPKDLFESDQFGCYIHRSTIQRLHESVLDTPDVVAKEHARVYFETQANKNMKAAAPAAIAIQACVTIVPLVRAATSGSINSFCILFLDSPHEKDVRK